ncbi:hypothetical protein [Dysosmobacter sp.]|uniref:hypothetical protein n=1 Tax=Dysosmobacter sp. TaxID=2591382 RepID=UPI002A89E1BE|nr:hypothetical protein [Dysosmobacter sp.]MDY3282022.1 hypothetical protein [Dysosmobacter sp.]
MRDRTTLSLMELTLMLLLFAMTAAICLRAFALSDRLSRQAEQRDRAVLWAETLAETWKAAGGDLAHPTPYETAPEGDGWTVCLDENWTLTGDPERTAFEAELREEPGVGLLRRARITVREVGGGCLFTLETACQEAA